MSLDKLNAKLCRIPVEKDEAFQNSIPALGSAYLRMNGTTLIVGDGQTKGGVEFVNREWTLQQIANANWKAIAEKEVFRMDGAAADSPMSGALADSEISGILEKVDIYSSASGEVSSS